MRKAAAVAPDARFGSTTSGFGQVVLKPYVCRLAGKNLQVWDQGDNERVFYHLRQAPRVRATHLVFAVSLQPVCSGGALSECTVLSPI